VKDKAFHKLGRYGGERGSKIASQGGQKDLDWKKAALTADCKILGEERAKHSRLPETCRGMIQGGGNYRRRNACLGAANTHLFGGQI